MRLVHGGIDIICEHSIANILLNLKNLQKVTKCIHLWHKRVFNMIYFVLMAVGNNRDNIKPNLVFYFENIHKMVGGLRDMLFFGFVYCPFWPAEVCSAPGFNFYKNDCISVLCYDIYFTSIPCPIYMLDGVAL